MFAEVTEPIKSFQGLLEAELRLLEEDQELFREVSFVLQQRVPDFAERQLQSLGKRNEHTKEFVHNLKQLLQGMKAVVEEQDKRDVLLKDLSEATQVLVSYVERDMQIEGPQQGE